MNIFADQHVSAKRVFAEQLYVPGSAPTGVVTLQPAPDGQSQRFVGTTTSATSGVVTLTGSNGGTTIGPLAFAVADNAFDFTIDEITAGTYSPTLTVTGLGGTSAVTGASSISIIGIEGGGELANSFAVVSATFAHTSKLAGLIAASSAHAFKILTTVSANYAHTHKLANTVSVSAPTAANRCCFLRLARSAARVWAKDFMG